MDPNEALERLHDARRYFERDDLTQQDIERAMEAFIALDDWLSQGGFLPDDWGRQS